MTRLEDPVEIGGLTVPNRLYRAPLLECAGTGDGAVDQLIEDLEPAAAAGAGLLCQGATIVTPEGGCAAPGMTRVSDPAFVSRLERLTDRIHTHDSRIAIQLEHGGLRSMETWHADYREDHPELRQLAPSEPPWPLRLLDRIGLLSYDARVLGTDEVYDLAEDFGRAAGNAADAGYDAIHIAGANMGLVHQFLSPFYNRRDDEFADGVRFLEAIGEAVREHAGDVPLLTKVPAETEAPPFVRRRFGREDCVDACERLAAGEFDAVVPVNGSVFWDMSIIRGQYPARAWQNEALQEEYAAAFGGRIHTRLVALGNRVESWFYGFEPAWNAGLCREVRDRVEVPVLAEGGIRGRAEMDRLLGADCDMVGMARPFYAEPRLPARLLADDASDGRGDDATGRSATAADANSVDPGTAAVCNNCNNCTVPQVTGAPGMCRTPDVLERVGQLRRSGAYDRDESSE